MTALIMRTMIPENPVLHSSEHRCAVPPVPIPVWRQGSMPSWHSSAEGWIRRSRGECRALRWLLRAARPLRWARGTRWHGEVGQEAGEERRTVSDEGGDKQLFPAPLPMSAMATVTSPTIMSGMEKLRNSLKIPLNVTNIRTSGAGKNSANGNPQDDSNNDAWQQVDLDFLHSDSYLLNHKNSILIQN